MHNNFNEEIEKELQELNLGGKCISVSDSDKGTSNDYANLEANIFIKTEENREMMEESIHFAEESNPVGYRISPQTTAYANDTFLRTLGISYDEFAELDCDEQQKLIREYHKNSPKSKDRSDLVMVGSGEHSCFVETDITPEEDRIRLDDNLKYSKPIAKVRKIVRKIQK